MKRVNVPQSLGKGHALDAIFYTLRNFAELLYNVDTQPELTAGSELSKVSQLVSDEGYQEAKGSVSAFKYKRCLSENNNCKNQAPGLSVRGNCCVGYCGVACGIALGIGALFG